MKRSNKGYTLIGVIVATLITAAGVTTAAVMMRTEIQQQQSLVAQTQRATYATVQSEIAVQGIDPTKIVNPLSTIAIPTLAGTTQVNGQSAIGNVSVTQSNLSGGMGASETNVISVMTASQTGDRSGGFGLQTTTLGTAATSTSLTLSAPTVSFVGGVLTGANFPATTWFVIPGNPPGTIYRYTTDGSTPTDASPVWDVASASNYNLANFPPSVTLRAFNNNPSYLPSPAVSTGTLTFQMPSPAFGRASPPAVADNTVTYNEEFSGSPNGITISSSESLVGISYTIYYTVDGSDPAFSGTRSIYSAPIVIPVENWTWSGATGDPATAVIRAAIVGPGPSQYTQSSTLSSSYTNQPITLATPTFSFDSAGGPVSTGTTVNFGIPSGAATIRYSPWTDPTAASTAALSYTF